MSQLSEMFDLAGGLSKAIDEVMEFGRCARRLAFDSKLGTRRGIHVMFPRNDFTVWQEQFTESSPEKSPIPFRHAIFEFLASYGGPQRWLKLGEEKVTVGLRTEVFMPLKLVRACLSGPKFGRHSDIEYFMWRNIRRKYRYDHTPEVTHVFNLLTDSINMQFQSLRMPILEQSHSDESLSEKKRTGRGTSLDYHDDLSAPLSHVLNGDVIARKNAEVHRNVFLECCFMVGYVSPGYGMGKVRIQAEEFDSEFLLSKLFGLPTEMPGFDSLFGGGGIALAESSEPVSRTPPVGRTILIRGQFGTGKSSLGLALAAEVARKEGLAWVMPLEQTSNDCKHYLESMNALSVSDGPLPLDNVGQLTQVIEKQLFEEADAALVERAHSGAIVLLQTRKDDVDALFERVAERAGAIRGYSLRLFVIDPINSILGWDADSASQVRLRLMKRIEEIKQSGANLVLVAEDDKDARNPVRFVENVVDTVIDLSRDRRHGYSQRYIEVLKSRLQRDQRGEHPFSIKAGSGVTVFPSSAAVQARIRSRRHKGIHFGNRFGWDRLDEILGPDAIFPTDVIVLRGPEGTLKTHVGLLFLLGYDPATSDLKPNPTGARRSLILPIRDNAASIRALLESSFVGNHRSTAKNCKSVDHITVVEVAGGFIQPGAIFQVLEAQFEKAQAAGDVIDRVMIDNISHWEMSCPFIREDETFGDTLLQFLRRQRVTSLLVCSGTPGHPKSVVQPSLIDDANALINFQRIEFRGAQRVTLRVLKTRGMQHKQELFDLVLTNAGLQLGTTSKLLRVGTSGEVTPVPMRLYLHEENATHSSYNASIVDSLKPVLSRNVEVNSKDRTHLVRAIRLSPYSTVDELQILQLDEFQLPELAAPHAKNLLHVFAEGEWDNERWGDIAPRLVSRVRTGGSFFAIPYYDNVGLLAYQKEVGESCVQDWNLLADTCTKWESSASPSTHAGQVFFFFRTSIDENYNCLFFEILLSLGSAPPLMRGGHRADKDECQIKAWLEGEAVVKACSILRTLCHRVHMLTSSETTLHSDSLSTKDSDKCVESERRQTQVYHTAKVWRHWFTSLAHMLSEMEPSARRSIVVTPLPGGKTVAGEWYLGVPAYSAAPDVALEVIKILTTREEEFERLRRGVGLPTRGTLYSDEVISTLQSRRVNLSTKVLSGLFHGAFRRSRFDCYPKISRLLSFHLKRIIEIEIEPASPIDVGTRRVETAIKEELDALRRSIAFVLRQHPCERCEKCFSTSQ